MMHVSRTARQLRFVAWGAILVTLAACAEEEPPPVQFPPSLEPTANGEPIDGGDCKRLRINRAVEKWQDEGAALIGCPDEASASLLEGAIVGIVDGFYIVATPHSKPDNLSD